MNSLPRQRKLPKFLPRTLVAAWYTSRDKCLWPSAAMFGGLLSRFVSQTGTKGLALYIYAAPLPLLLFFSWWEVV